MDYLKLTTDQTSCSANNQQLSHYYDLVSDFSQLSCRLYVTWKQLNIFVSSHGYVFTITPSQLQYFQQLDKCYEYLENTNGVVPGLNLHMFSGMNEADFSQLKLRLSYNNHVRQIQLNNSIFMAESLLNSATLSQRLTAIYSMLDVVPQHESHFPTREDYENKQLSQTESLELSDFQRNPDSQLASSIAKATVALRSLDLGGQVEIANEKQLNGTQLNTTDYKKEDEKQQNDEMHKHKVDCESFVKLSNSQDFNTKPDVHEYESPNPDIRPKVSIYQTIEHRQYREVKQRLLDGKLQVVGQVNGVNKFHEEQPPQLIAYKQRQVVKLPHMKIKIPLLTAEERRNNPFKMDQYYVNNLQINAVPIVRQSFDESRLIKQQPSFRYQPKRRKTGFERRMSEQEEFQVQKQELVRLITVKKIYK